ncbi:hypothetical protein M406DRAFT_331336 [Cryphonectria parasitica EP155]|uniref:Rhodopsin domain-containing protein n=1 Tax=Cryphonectria parasitica (strain ATCC 38755 / EP155) TaxID=660469 RepID=A0A9P4Y111_CRYP1|nr:uncharacterized protein M406DRAFT_331336 [Cryphonectria parasitica EP155]KAF3765022.1 hypothetical protein M406DRAFT_331336 [Cryphonectria parasitica EP155]
MSLFQSIGSYDNLDEPTPFFNTKSAVYGFMITLLLLTWVTNVGSIFLVNAGLGQHFILLGIDGMIEFVKMFWWCNACYNMSMAAIKISLLFQYLRLLNEHPAADSRQPMIMRTAVIVLIAITAIWGIVYSILAWVPCVPIYADWDFTVSATRYGYGSDDKRTFVTTFMVHGACNMAIDIAIFALPLFSRSMWAAAGRQRQSRIAMIFLYGLGVVSVLCSIFRFVSIVDHKAATYPTFDPTWYGPTAIVLSILEVDLATIMASLPVFWPYLRRNIDRIMITHEIEVKVTEQHFTQIDDRGLEGGRNTRSHEGVRSESAAGAAAYTPWMDGDGHRSNSSAGLKMGEVVMMRTLGRSGTDEGSESSPTGDDMPFDGSRNAAPQRSPQRAAFLTRDSKEILLH